MLNCHNGLWTFIFFNLVLLMLTICICFSKIGMYLAICYIKNFLVDFPHFVKSDLKLFLITYKKISFKTFLRDRVNMPCAFIVLICNKDFIHFESKKSESMPKEVICSVPLIHVFFYLFTIYWQIMNVRI